MILKPRGGCRPPQLGLWCTFPFRCAHAPESAGGVCAAVTVLADAGCWAGDRTWSVLFVVGRVGVAQRAAAAAELGQVEGVVAMDVDVAAHERGEPGDVLVQDRVALGS